MSTRILLLDTGKEWGGGTNSMIELLKRLDRERFSVTAVFYRNYLKGEHSDLRKELTKLDVPLEILPPPRQPLTAKIAKELIRGLLHFFPAARRRALFAIERWWRIAPLAARLSAKLRAGGFDLLYMNNQPSSNLEGYLAAAETGLPVVQHCRIEVLLAPEEVAIVNRTAREIICVSDGVRRSLVKRGIDPAICCVVYNAIDGRQALPSPITLNEAREGSIVIGSIGQLVARKANNQLLRAAAIVKKRCKTPFHLVLVGEGPEGEQLRHLANKLGLSPQVTFAGFQQHPLAWEAAMDIVVLASAKEGLPRVLLEAMLLGKPVVASDVVGSQELVMHGETGLLYPYGDEAQLADHLQTLLGNAELRRAMGSAGRKKVLADFSITHYVAGVEKILTEAVS